MRCTVLAEESGTRKFEADPVTRIENLSFDEDTVFNYIISISEMSDAGLDVAYCQRQQQLLVNSTKAPLRR